MIDKFPYEAKIKDTGNTFVPTMIDYDNRMVWHQKGQASGNGEWIDFECVEFVKNEKFIDLAELNEQVTKVN